MNLYYKIKVPDCTQDLQTLANKFDLNPSKYTVGVANYYVPNETPTLTQLFARMNLSPAIYFGFAISPRTSQRTLVHIDGRNVQASMNFPIGNTETKIMWYTDKQQAGTELSRVTKTAVVIPPVDYSTWVPTDETVFDQPMFVRTNIWHSVSNDTDKSRLTLSFRFYGNPTIEELIERYLASRVGLEPTT